MGGVSNAALARHARVSVVACRKRKFVVARTSGYRDEENSVLISAASAWETTTKYRLGKLPDAAAVALDFGGAIADQGFEELAISVEDASLAGSLSGPHRDPFDRMLIAQALSGNLVLVSKEAIFEKYGVRRLW